MKRRLSPPALGTKRRAFSPPLPPGWSRWHDKAGRPYFINEDDGTTTWEDPRAPDGQTPVQHERAAPLPRHQAPPPSTPAVPWRGTQPSGGGPKHYSTPHNAPVALVPPLQSNSPSLNAQHPDAGTTRDSSVQLHISGLDPTIEEKHIRGHFRNYGKFVSKCIRLKDNYCFLHFGDNLGPALAAIAELDGQPLLGRALRVRLTKNTCEQYGIPGEPSAPPRQGKPPPQQFAAPPSGSGALPPTTAPLAPNLDEPVQVHVSGLVPGMTEDDVRDFFRSFRNRIVKVHCKAEKGFAFVHLDSIRAARAAIDKLNGRSDRQGNRIKVDLSSHDAMRYGPRPPGQLLQGPPYSRQGMQATAITEAEPTERRGAEDDIQLFVGGLSAETSTDDIWQCFSDCPVSKVHRVKDNHCFIHLPDINTALDVMRDKEGSRCGSRIVRIALSTAACKRYNVPPQPHRKPQLILRGMPPDGTIEDVRIFLADHSGIAEEIGLAENPGEWSVVVSGVQEALDCYQSLDGKYFLGSTVELRLSDASSRCLNLPPRPEKQKR